MSQLETFNKLMVIAPSDELILDSGIDAERYGDMAANIFFGYLERDEKDPQIYIMSGYMGELATWAEESTHRISKHLLDTYNLPSAIMPSENEKMGLKTRFLRMREQYGEVLGEEAAKKREIGLISDDLQMDLGRYALSQLGIQSAGFRVRAPIFVGGEQPQAVAQEPVDLSTYVAGRYPRRQAGDI